MGIRIDRSSAAPEAAARSMTRARGAAGFSLVEVLVALIVVSVGMIGIAALYGQGLSAGRNALYRTQAVNLASDMAERIRANRLGRLGYNDAAPTHQGCDDVDCTPAQMAVHDLSVWTRHVEDLLPNGEGTVVAADGIPPSYTINVAWQETGIGAVEHEIVIHVPSY